MARKGNIRSIRFSDELAELIDRQAGRNFTEKFENLVTRCIWELPAKEAQLERLEDRINDEQKRLQELAKRRIELEKQMNRIQAYMLQELQQLKKL